jgi:hypothetical protein
MNVYDLEIDPEFKQLIAPLDAEERRLLEENIVRDGCRDPISVWKKTILDGHNRYEICQKHQIPFNIVQIKIRTREEAVAWICENQLGRRNISEETRRYLIGKRYSMEKIIGARNPNGVNQHTRNEVWATIPTKPKYERSAVRTRERLGNEYHISHATVFKYEMYTQALDRLKQCVPELVSRILSGQIKISQENIIELSRHSAYEIEKLYRSFAEESEDGLKYSDTRSFIPPKPESAKAVIPTQTGSIKDMPAYDPDAEVASLALTIPSWVSSVLRAKSTTRISEISDTAKNKLEKELVALRQTVDELLDAISEDKQ